MVNYTGGGRLPWLCFLSAGFAGFAAANAAGDVVFFEK